MDGGQAVYQTNVLRSVSYDSFSLIFFIDFSQHFVYMNTDLQPNLQYITYDIIHMFMGEKNKQNAIFLYRKIFSIDRIVRLRLCYKL